MQKSKKYLSCLLGISMLVVVNTEAHMELKPLVWHAHWPVLPPQHLDPEQEKWVTKRLAQMTLKEKVAQMLIIEYQAITPEEAAQYKIGAMLHAAGQVNLASQQGLSQKCRMEKYVSLTCWAEFADLYWNAVKTADWANDASPVPLLWGTDAVHGAGAIYGATLFPHNIGMGAAVIGDPANYSLLQEAQVATRELVALQGFRQIFAPTIAVARNRNWGRNYESFSENPVIAYNAAHFAVKGLQTPWFEGRHEQHMVATLKHFVGDGGTTTGTGYQTMLSQTPLDPTDTVFLQKRTDEGLNQYSEDLLINVHAPGFFSGIEAGAHSVMASYSSWENGKLHGDGYLLTDVLKDTLGFNGFIISDYDAIEQVEGCTIYSCPKSVNAGVDLFMISNKTPGAWKIFHENTIMQVLSGEIPESRINDAVRRILRAKYAMGLLTASKPSKTYQFFGYKNLHQAEKRLNQWAPLAKELAQKSMVLMKNENALPFKAHQFTKQPLLVAGSALDSPQMQLGGWGLQWQGFDSTAPKPFHNKADYPQAITVLEALKKSGISLCHYQTGKEFCALEAKKALVVMGEHSYAEWWGDIHASQTHHPDQTIAYKTIREQYAQDEALVKKLKAHGYEVTTVFFSGRPLVVDALERSDAFIAGFLPGSQGGPAIVDLLFAKHGANFEGRLPFSWPTKIENTSVFNTKPGQFRGTDAQWLAELAQGESKEVLVKSHYPYAYGTGLSY